MPDIKLATEDGIAHIRFDRPTVFNALSPSLLQELIELCTDIAANDTCRVVVLEGVGEHFSAGADLPKFMQDLESDPQATADLGRRATDSLAALPQITIAAVQGYCVGGALVLAAACDIRLVADDRRFFIPELDAGIPLAWGGSCRHFGADDALQSGFASRIIAAADLRAETESLAQSIAHKAQIILRMTKQQLNSIRNGTFDASNDAHAMLAALADPDARQASLDYVRNNIHKGDRRQR